MYITTECDVLTRTTSSFGYPTFACSRSELIKVLYEAIPDREKRVKPNSRIVSIETGSDGVQVHLKDGTVQEGSVVVGVDGVHSKTREEIQRLSNTSAGEHPMTTTFYGIYGRSARKDGFESGVFYESHGTNKVSQMFRVGDGIHYAFLKSVKTPTTEKGSYDAVEMEKLAEEFAEDYVSPTVKFKEVWKETNKVTARLVNQEEGFAEKWYHERIALVGDAAHKMTSVTGQGVNCGMHSAATFANELRSTLQSNPHPTTKQLEEAFARYQQTREEESKGLFSNSVMATRLVTWHSWRAWIMDRFILPWMNMAPMLQQFTNQLSAGQILDYVPFTEQKGTVAWLKSVVS